MSNRTSISRLSTVLLWLLVINLGIALGAGLFESRIAVPHWIETGAGGASWNADAARDDDTGRRFWVGVTTLPLTILTLANLFVAWKAPGPARRWWVTAALAALTDRVFTLSYFVPTMLRLMRMPDSNEAAAVAIRWAQLNHVRHVIVLVAWLAALKAFSHLYRQLGRVDGVAVR